MATRTLEYMPLDALLPALKNAKGHDPEGLRASVEAFGWLEPQLLDERTGRLVAGHGRLQVLQAAEAEGMAPPDGIVVDEDGHWRAPVVRGFHSRDDDHAHAAGIALNRLVERGGWVRDALAEQLQELADSPVGLVGTGYTADDLDDLLAGLGSGELPPQPTEASHAHHPERGEPQVPREVQGLREVGLMFHADHHRQYLEHLAKLKRAWGEDAAPVVVLRALAEAAERA